MSELLARLWGWYLLIIGVAVLLRSHQTARAAREMSRSPAVIFLIGPMALIVGLIHIAVHNIWTADWRSLITLFGWLTTAKGVTALMFPDVIALMSDKIAAPKVARLMGLGAIAVAAILFFLAYT